MQKEQQITHQATVSSQRGDIVRVLVEVKEMCQSCTSRNSCALSKMKNQRVIDIKCDSGKVYEKGQTVTVATMSSAANLAVFYCYVLPLIVLAGTLTFMVQMKTDEGISAILALAFLAIYYTCLYFFRNKLSKKIIFKIND